MALKLPTLGNKDKKPTNTGTPAPAKTAKSGSSIFGFLNKGKPKSPLASTTAAGKPATGGAPSTAGGMTGDQTRKIKAEVAANKVTKGKKDGAAFKLPFIGDRPAEQQLPILLIIAGFFGALTIGAIVLDAINRSNVSTYTNITSQLQFHTQRLAKSAGLAARGDAVSFPQLQDSRDEFQRYLEVLNAGGEAFNTTVPTARISEELTSRLEELTKRFGDASGSATAILAAKTDLVDLSRNIAQVRAGAEELAALSQDLTGLMQQSGAPPAQVLKVNRLTFLAERLGRGSAEILGAEVIDPEVPFLMGKDTNDFRELIKALESGSDALGISALRDGDAKTKVGKLREQFTSFEQNIGPILGNVQKLVSARQSGRALQQGSEQLLSNVEQLQGAFAVEKKNVPLILAIVFGVIALVVLALIAAVFLSDARKRAAESEAENKRNQEAILRLLNEMGDLADGDLTIRAKVTEDITGAIADSMNYTIDELRTLVTGGKQRVDAGVGEVPTSAGRVGATARRCGETIEGNSGHDAGRVGRGGNADQGVVERGRVFPSGYALAGGGRQGPPRGAELHFRHERHSRPDSGNIETDQATGRKLAGDRRDRGTDFRHYRTDERAGTERRHPGGVGR